MNLPNTLTLLRIFFVPVLIVVLLTRSPNVELWGVPFPFEVFGGKQQNGYAGNFKRHGQAPKVKGRASGGKNDNEKGKKEKKQQRKGIWKINKKLAEKKPQF